MRTTAVVKHEVSRIAVLGGTVTLEGGSLVTGYGIEVSYKLVGKKMWCYGRKTRTVVKKTMLLC